MSKPDFEKCTQLATELLYKQNIQDRTLDIRNLKYDKTIIFESIQNYCLLTHTPLSTFISDEKQTLKDGCTLVDKDNNLYVVLYNDEITYYEHLNWTLAHEIGHIYLGHTKDNELEEIEAHFFAAQLFMPEYSIFMMSKEYGTITPETLSEIFGVSPEAAWKRLRTMNRKNFYRSSRIDKEIWNIQRKRVELYFECEKNPYKYRNYLSFMLCTDEEAEMLWRMYSNAY